MKLLIISDVHANIDALKTVVEEEPDTDKIYCAGDIVDYGLNPCEVIKYIRENNIHCVMGNHDRNLLRIIDEEPMHDMSQPFSFVQYCISLMSNEDVEFIRALPNEIRFDADGIEYYMTHYFKPNYDTIWSRSMFDEFWRSRCTDSDPGKEHRCIFGHTHRSCFLTIDDKKLWLNPGSVSYRRGDDHTKDANYAVIEDGKISLRTVPYPRRHLYDRVVAMNLTENEKNCGKFFYCDSDPE